MDFLIKWGLRALAIAAVLGAIYYGIDQVAAAFRERKQLQYDVGQLQASEAAKIIERDEARVRAKENADFAQREIAERNRLSRESAETQRRIQRELNNAKSKLAAWEASADADLARCLDQRVPRWLLDGSGEAPDLAGPGAGGSLPEAR